MSIPRGTSKKISGSNPASKPWITTYSRKLDWSYEVTQEEVGRGSFGLVKAAVARNVNADSTVGVWMPQVGEEVVLKYVSKAKVAAHREVVLNEVDIFKTLTSHPGFPKLYDIYETKEDVIFVMEFCRGGELTNAILNRNFFSEKDAAAVFVQVLRSVAHMHTNKIIHRDIKPANFLLAQEVHPDTDMVNVRVCCADFGLAKFLTDVDERLTDASGTLDMMAPEQLGNDPCYKGLPADVWSCGCMLFVLLSGKLPFDGPNGQIIQTKIRGAMFDFHPPEVWENVSENAKDLIRQMMRLDRESRITAERALAHPWFTECQEASTTTQLDTMVVTHLQQFKKWGAVKKGITQQLAKHLATLAAGGPDAKPNEVANNILRTRSKTRHSGSAMQQELEERARFLRSIFDSLDTEKTGTITASQLMEAMEKIGFSIEEDEVNAMVESLDADHNHLLDYEEFLAGALRLQDAEQTDMLEAVFAQFDTNDDGLISIDELRAVLNVSTEEDEEQLQKFMLEVDLDGNGELDYMEFLQVFGQDSL